jgi:Flp pilus assembly protein TadD
MAEPVSPDAAAHALFASALRWFQSGELAKAQQACGKILEHSPENPSALNLLGGIRCQEKRFAEAVELLLRAVRAEPDAASIHYNLAGAYRSNGQMEEAIGSFRKALSVQPTLADAHHNLGLTLQDCGRVDEAVASLRMAVVQQPRNARYHNSLGWALWNGGAGDEAVTHYHGAIRLQPDYAPAHNNLALAWLSRGDLLDGWREYDWRWKVAGFAGADHHVPGPLWVGGDLKGKRLLVYTEQGFGDALQFGRYIPLLTEKGARVILQCRRELWRLFQSLQGVERLVVKNEEIGPYDVQCPLMSLPRAFGTNRQTIPSAVPYLQAPADAVEEWGRRLGPAGGRLRVGLAWWITKQPDLWRTCPLERFLPLIPLVDRLQFYSLQVDAALEHSPDAARRLALVDLRPHLTDFAETAALMEHLDLVLSVDTSVVHVAGALGRPTWVLLPHIADWRWMQGRADSPWYPTARLFRQPARGEWDAVIDRVLACLSELPPRQS